MSGLSLAVTFRQSWCAGKTESEALISEAADAMALAAQPGVTPERFPEPPCPYCHCSTENLGDPGCGLGRDYRIKGMT